MSLGEIFTFIIFSIFIIVFCIYSVTGLFHLRNYGYVGDACQKVMIGYSVVSISIIIAAIVLFII